MGQKLNIMPGPEVKTIDFPKLKIVKIFVIRVIGSKIVRLDDWEKIAEYVFLHKSKRPDWEIALSFWEIRTINDRFLKKLVITKQGDPDYMPYDLVLDFSEVMDRKFKGYMKNLLGIELDKKETIKRGDLTD